MKKRAETCVKVVYRILPKPHNPSEIKGSERTHAKTIDFNPFFNTFVCKYQNSYGINWK